MTTRRDVLVGLGAAAAAAAIPGAVIAEAAIREWQIQEGSWDEEHDCCQACELNPCGCDLAAQRVPAWDDKTVIAGDTDWWEAGFGAYCSRCSYETHPDNGGELIHDQIVCQDCLTLADYKVCSPDHYAELIEDLMCEEYGEATA